MRVNLRSFNGCLKELTPMTPVHQYTSTPVHQYTSTPALYNKLITLVAMSCEGILGDDEFPDVLNEVLEDKKTKF